MLFVLFLAWKYQFCESQRKGSILRTKISEVEKTPYQCTRNFGSAELRSSLFLHISAHSSVWSALEAQETKVFGFINQGPYRSSIQIMPKVHHSCSRRPQRDVLSALGRVLFIALQMNHERILRAFPPADQLLYLCLSSHVLAWQLSACIRLVGDSPSCQHTRQSAGVAASCLSVNTRLLYSVCEHEPERQS